MNQLAVNPATEKYTLTEVLNLPVFAGSDISIAAANHLRITRVKEHIAGALNAASDAGFYFASKIEDSVNLMRSNMKTLIEEDQVIKTAILNANLPFTLTTDLISSRDGATQTLVFTLYVGTTLLVSETRVKAANSFVASESDMLQLNKKFIA